MKIRKGARFWSSLPSEHIEEDGDVRQFGGRPVTLALAEILSKLGYDVDGPFDEGEQGLQLVATSAKRRFLVQVTYLDWYALLVDEVTPSLRKMFTGKYGAFKSEDGDSLPEVLKKLAAGMAADPRFERIEWFEEPGDAFLEEVQGEQEPVDGE